jgi:esterase/lipase superfamily enzyme
MRSRFVSPFRISLVLLLALLSLAWRSVSPQSAKKTKRKVETTKAAPLPTTTAEGVGAQRMAFDLDVQRLSEMDPLPSVGDTISAALEYVAVPVYFATRRRIAGRLAEPEQYYGGDDDTVKYGVATVTIPARRRPGTADGRGWCRFLPGPLACARSSANSVLVSSLTPVGADDWLARLGRAIDSSAAPADVMIFVHGYNNSSADVMHRAAQVAYDAGFNGVALAYDWASKGETALYTADEATAERSVPDFERFLRRVADSTHARRIAIVAHSMGTRLVSYALRDLAPSAAELRIDQVIFAAADIDSATFVQQLAMPVTKSSRHVTLYASHRDRALQASADIVHHAPRVGGGPPSLIVGNGLDYIDASSVDTDLIGHGYFSENKELLDDIFLILRHGFPAEDRNLRRLGVGERVYYQLR